MDWVHVTSTIHALASGVETDAYLDEVASEVLAFPGDVDASWFAIALSKATSALTLKSLLLAFGASAKTSASTVDVLLNQFDIQKDQAFLGPVVLDAFFLLACRDTLARTTLSTVLQRISGSDNEFLVTKAAKVCGRLLHLAFARSCVKN